MIYSSKIHFNRDIFRFQLNELKMYWMKSQIIFNSVDTAKKMDQSAEAHMLLIEIFLKK